MTDSGLLTEVLGLKVEQIFFTFFRAQHPLPPRRLSVCVTPASLPFAWSTCQATSQAFALTAPQCSVSSRERPKQTLSAHKTSTQANANSTKRVFPLNTTCTISVAPNMDVPSSITIPLMTHLFLVNEVARLSAVQLKLRQKINALINKTTAESTSAAKSPLPPTGMKERPNEKSSTFSTVTTANQNSMSISPPRSISNRRQAPSAGSWRKSNQRSFSEESSLVVSDEEAAAPLPPSSASNGLEHPPDASLIHPTTINHDSARSTIFAEFSDNGNQLSSTPTVMASCSLKPPEEAHDIADINSQELKSIHIVANISESIPAQHPKFTAPDAHDSLTSPETSSNQCSNLKYIPTHSLTPQLILTNLDEFNSTRLKEICNRLNLPKSGKIAKLKILIKNSLSLVQPS